VGGGDPGINNLEVQQVVQVFQRQSADIPFRIG